MQLKYMEYHHRSFSSYKGLAFNFSHRRIILMTDSPRPPGFEVRRWSFKMLYLFAIYNRLKKKPAQQKQYSVKVLLSIRNIKTKYIILRMNFLSWLHRSSRSIGRRLLLTLLHILGIKALPCARTDVRTSALRLVGPKMQLGLSTIATKLQNNVHCSDIFIWVIYIFIWAQWNLKELGLVSPYLA